MTFDSSASVTAAEANENFGRIYQCVKQQAAKGVMLYLEKALTA